MYEQVKTSTTDNKNLLTSTFKNAITSTIKNEFTLFCMETLNSRKLLVVLMDWNILMSQYKLTSRIHILCVLFRNKYQHKKID